MSRTLICGSRSFDDYDLFCKSMDIVLFDRPETEIVSGGAKGADSFAALYAVDHEYDFKEFKPDWKKFGRSAGLKRNDEMIAYAMQKENPVVVAFWDGKSRGTAYTIKHAKAQGLQVYVVNYTATGKELMEAFYGIRPC